MQQKLDRFTRESLDTASRMQDKAMLEYYTKDRIIETWRRAEAAGINTMISNNESAHVVDAVDAYLKDGGKLQWIAQVAIRLRPVEARGRGQRRHAPRRQRWHGRGECRDGKEYSRGTCPGVNSVSWLSRGRAEASPGVSRHDRTALRSSLVLSWVASRPHGGFLTTTLPVVRNPG